MRVLIADKLSETGLCAFREAGLDVLSEPALQGEALRDRVAEANSEVLVIRSTKVPREVLAAGPLALVVRAGAGVNNVDTDAASQLGIYVANCPGKNAIAVAELTLGLLLALDRRIPDCVAELRAERWDKKRFSKAEGLFGRTLAIVGLGEIGRQVAVRARAFGMRVIAWSRSLTDERSGELGIERAATPLAAVQQADAVSIHLALTDETRGMVGDEFLGAMKPGALLINTSRGDVIDGEALARAVEQRGIRVGLDVWNRQPKSSVAPFGDPLGALPAVYGTPHIGASTQQAQDAVAAEALRVVLAYRDTGEVPNCVNLSTARTVPCTLMVRHLDRVGVLASVLSELKADQINVLEMRNVLFQGEGAAACATIQVSRRPEPDLLERLASREHVLNVSVALNPSGADSP